MPETRIYFVSEYLPGAPSIHYLVEASSGAQALRHVVKPRFHVHVPTTKEVAALMRAGVKVEDATTEGGKQ